MDQNKRKLRGLKRAIKRAGQKASRQRLKRGLAADPAEAHTDQQQFGRDSSASLNGFDNDVTRRREETKS